ncbi:MAG: sulfatase family protein [Bacteroidales bacterium]
MKNSVLLFTGLCSIGALASCQQEETKNEFPNIVIIFADDMGYGDVSGLNPEAKTYTPAIDGLIEEGLTFTEAHASASVSTPSRYGLLTGRYAFRNKINGGNVNGFEPSVFEQERRTMADLLNDAGYTTACVGKWHLGFDWETEPEGEEPRQSNETNYSNVSYSKSIEFGPNFFGFDYSFIHPASLDIPPYLFLENQKAIEDEVILSSDVYPLRLEDTEYAWDKKHTQEDDIYWDKGVWWRDGEMAKSFRIEECQGDIVDEGIQFIERQKNNNKDNPFFLYLALTGPHTPWVPEDRFKGKSAMDTYGDFILNIDHIVERVDEKLESLGFSENTMLIFASDNGGYWPEQEIALQKHDSNYGRRGQKGDVWDGGHHEPLIIKWPSKIKSPVTYNHLISFTDFYATFAELTGQELEKNAGEDSFSFLHVLNGDTAKPVRNSMIHHSSAKMFAIRMNGWKYIDGLGSGGFTSPTRSKPEPGEPEGQLYNMDKDPKESNNLFTEHPEMVKKLQEKLEKQKEQGYTREMKKENK